MLKLIRKRKNYFSEEELENEFYEKMNLQGNLLAATSSTGQSLKIFDTQTLNILFDFKRGSENAEICNMEFSQDNKYFICSSNRCTIHIFCLTQEGPENKNPVKFFEKISSVVKKIGDEKYITKHSSFARIKCEIPSICAIYDTNKIIAINSSGCLMGEFNSDKGGEGNFTTALDF